MALSYTIERRAAAAAEVEAALARLEHLPGIYFGCDCGVPGLHPLQATLLAGPSLAIRIFEDGAEADALDALGRALLHDPRLGAFVALARRGAGHHAFDAARAFLAAFDRAADALLVGALRFEAHRLGVRAAATADAIGVRDAGAASAPIGVLFFGADLLRRDADGLWHRVTLRFDDPELARRQRRTTPAASDVAARAERAARASAPASTPEPHDDFPPGGYAAVVARAVERLAQQPLVSLTLSQSFRRRSDGVSAARAFAALRRANPAPATFFVHTTDGERLFGASPDLQLVVRGTELESFPVCGTVARGHGPLGEAESLRKLLDEEVDAASLAVCTDALRNDLAPLCEPGSLRLRDRRRPMALATVVHTVDRLSGRLRAGADAWDAIVATAAPVMLTGTPRALALAAIDALEAGPRGWYGGLAVQVGADGDALVGTILRAAVLHDGVAEVRTGGDLMADSDPAREEHESRIKAVSLWRALGLAVEAELQAVLAGPAGEDSASARTDAARPAVAAHADAALPAAIALCDAGDPFAAAVIDTLQGLGLVLDPAAPARVLIGADAALCAAAGAHGAGLVALGDAAVRVLQHAGFAVAPIRPEHGRAMHCMPTPAAPWHDKRAFAALRHATLAVDWEAAASSAAAHGWTVWALDDAQHPAVLAHAARRSVCLLLRPESLLSDRLAHAALRAAIAFAAQR